MQHRAFALETRPALVPLLSGVLVGCAASPSPAAAVPPPLTATSVATSTTERPMVLDSSLGAQALEEPGWLLSGGGRDAYVVRRDAAGGRPAWVLEPVSDALGRYGTWMRQVDAADYRGKRVRITAEIKTRDATRRADFWARVQAKNSPSDGPGLGGDWEKLPADSDWAHDAIVLDVPAGADRIEYGVGLAGPGRVWLESATLEVVGTDVPLSSGIVGAPPSNGASGDTSSVRHWMLTGDDVADYAIELDTAIKHSGRASGSLRSTAPHPHGFGTIDQWLGPAPYRGKRLRMRAFVKAEQVTGWAGLWMRVDAASAPAHADQSGAPKHQSTAFDNMENRPIKGTSDWARYEVVLDVARDASAIAFGLLLSGPGKVWIDDVTFDVVDASVPTTGRNSDSRPAENLDFEE
jgi:hypothetical protein